MSYRGNYKRDANVKDVFDSTNYRVLCDRFVTVNGQKMPYKFFCDLRDIALGLSTDGFAPFKRRERRAGLSLFSTIISHPKFASI